MPVFGICLGHQLLSQAVGLETFKLPVRPPRRQPPGQGPAHGPDRDHRAEPRLRGARRGRASGCRPTSARPSSPTSTSTTARSRASGCSTCPPAASSTTPRRARARTTRSGCSTSSSARSRPRMPRRDDLHKILVLGSGPIVIGQAAEFDYSGAQACKVLLEEGYEVVLVNSNPATIMTDPEFATATYVEPLLPEVVAQVIERERPDALLPTLGGQTALNLAKALLRGRHARALRRRADRRELRRDQPRRGPRAVRRDDAAPPACARRATRSPRASSRRARRAGELGLPLIIRPAFTLGGRGGGIARSAGGVRADRRAGPRRVADRPGADRRVRARLGRVRARGHARRRGQRRDRLLDRERRPDGRPHRRLGDRRAADVADRPPVPDAARPGDRRDPRRRGRDGRLERPVRGQPARRTRSS